MEKQITYFHVPGVEAADRYVPGNHGQGNAFGASIESFVFLPKDTLVTIHGLEGKRYRVVETQFHVGHADEAEGVHIILKEEPPEEGVAVQDIEFAPGYFGVA